jgi:suppressor of tumorigenicity protein 13
MPSTILNVTQFKGTFTDLETLMLNSSKYLIVLEFWAYWCPPCRRIAQMLPGIAKSYPAITFLRVDIDQNRDLQARYHIDSVPHWECLKLRIAGVQEVSSFRGADMRKVRERIVALMRQK